MISIATPGMRLAARAYVAARLARQSGFVLSAVPPGSSGPCSLQSPRASTFEAPPMARSSLGLGNMARVRVEILAERDGGMRAGLGDAAHPGLDPAVEHCDVLCVRDPLGGRVERTEVDVVGPALEVIEEACILSTTRDHHLRRLSPSLLGDAERPGVLCRQSEVYSYCA